MGGKLLWIPLYAELTKALLSCKNDRKPLVDWIYSDISQVGDKSLVEYIHKMAGASPLSSCHHGGVGEGWKNI